MQLNTYAGGFNFTSAGVGAVFQIQGAIGAIIQVTRLVVAPAPAFEYQIIRCSTILAGGIPNPVVQVQLDPLNAAPVCAGVLAYTGVPALGVVIGQIAGGYLAAGLPFEHRWGTGRELAQPCRLRGNNDTLIVYQQTIGPVGMVIGVEWEEF